MPDKTLIEFSREFFANQLPDLERDLAAFIAEHPIWGDLPERDQKNAARCAATHLILAIRAESKVGLVR